jgi:hypothetical protein
MSFWILDGARAKRLIFIKLFEKINKTLKTVLKKILKFNLVF